MRCCDNALKLQVGIALQELGFVSPFRVDGDPDPRHSRSLSGTRPIDPGGRACSELLSLSTRGADKKYATRARAAAPACLSARTHPVCLTSPTLALERLAHGARGARILRSPHGHALVERQNLANL